MAITPRLALPLLTAAQAQKEITHNEALTLLDIAAQPIVEAIGLTLPPAAPQPGQCWVIGAAPTGDWTGQAGALAGWTRGGWRYVLPTDGFSVWSRIDNGIARYDGVTWVIAARQAAIATPGGGGVVDVEARAALAAILAALRVHRLISAA